MNVFTIIMSYSYTVFSGNAVIVTSWIVVIHVVSLVQVKPSCYCPTVIFNTLWKAALLCHVLYIVALCCTGMKSLLVSQMLPHCFRIINENLSQWIQQLSYIITSCYAVSFNLFIFNFFFFAMLLPDAVQLLPSSCLNLPSDLSLNFVQLLQYS